MLRHDLQPASRPTAAVRLIPNSVAHSAVLSTQWTPSALRGLQPEIGRCTPVNIGVSTNMNWRYGHSQTTTIKLYLMTVTFTSYLKYTESRDSSVGIATGYDLDDRGVGVRVPVGQEFSLPHVVQTGSRAHPASSPMGTGGSFPRGKVAGACSWPLTSN
jgi:hypothetical protein